MSRNQTLAAVAVAIIAAFVAYFVSPDLLGAVLTTAAIGLGMALGMYDANLEKSIALPNGAATVTADGLDLGNTINGDFVARCELQIVGPLLAVGELANGSTMSYDIYHAVSSDFSDEVLLAGSVLVQTGAGGVSEVLGKNGRAITARRINAPIAEANRSTADILKALTSLFLRFIV